MPPPVSKEDALSDSTREVDRIRDILFGAQMRDYSQQFDLMQRDVERLQQALDQLHEQLTAQDADQNRKIQTVRREVRQADDELRAEQRATADQLREDKADRQVLAELFIQLGNQLKNGASVSELLEQLTRASNTATDQE